MAEAKEVPIQVLAPGKLKETSVEIRTTSAQEGIRKAQDFFGSEGFTVGNNGTLQPPFVEEKLNKLRARKDSILEKTGGSLMPTQEEFYQDVLLTASLWPQVNNGEIHYLIGRGAGIEAALRGEVEGRGKNNITLPFRGHSDFDFYGVPYETLPDSLGALHPERQVYTLEFQTVFGNQEIYPLQATKAFHDKDGRGTLPGKFIHETAETVNLGGIKVLIPELELLALDKLLTPEATPRHEGRKTITDAVSVALQYNLDREKMLAYYERFVVEPQTGKTVDQAVREGADSYIYRLQRQYGHLIKEVMQKEGVSSDQAMELINAKVSHFAENPKEAKELVAKSAEDMRETFGFMFGISESSENPASRITSDIVIARAIVPGFIEPDYWNPLKPGDFDQDGKIVSLEYRDQVLAKYRKVREPEIRRERGRKVIDFFAEVDRARAA